MKIKFEYNENNENDLFVKKRRVKENQNETKKFSKQNQKIDLIKVLSFILFSILLIIILIFFILLKYMEMETLV